MGSRRTAFPDAELFPNGLPPEMTNVAEDYAHAKKWMDDVKAKIRKEKEKPQLLDHHRPRKRRHSASVPDKKQSSSTPPVSSPSPPSSSSSSRQSAGSTQPPPHPTPHLAPSSTPPSRGSPSKTPSDRSQRSSNTTDGHTLPHSATESKSSFVPPHSQEQGEAKEVEGDGLPPSGDYVPLPGSGSARRMESSTTDVPLTPVNEMLSRPRPTPTLQIMRVNQADADQLDNELFRMLKFQFVQIFRYFQNDFLDQYGPEIDAGIMFLIWRFSVYKNEPSAGSQLQNLRYRDEWYKGGRQLQSFDIPLGRRLLHGFLSIGVRWGWVRLTRMMTSEGYGGYQEGTWQRRVYKLTRYLENLYKFFSLCNFFHFLSTGLYRSLVDRLLGMRLVYNHHLVMRQISFELMNQQLVWSSLSEFAMFILPLINRRKMVNWVRRVLRLNQMKSDDDDTDDLGGCPVCGDHPITIPFVANCGCIFCYYCLRSSRMADQSQFRCPSCAQVITSQKRYVVGQRRRQEESRGHRLGSQSREEEDERKDDEKVGLE